MKNLKVIQTICKVGKVLATIGFVVTIVLLILSVLSAALIVKNQDKPMFSSEEELNEVKNIIGSDLNMEDTIKTFFEKNFQQFNFVTAICLMIFSAVMMLVSNIKCLLMKTYFKKELEVGTPFNEELGKHLMKNGIFFILVSLVATIVCDLGVSIYNSGVNIDSLKIDTTLFGGFSIVDGLIIILIAFIINCAIDFINESKNNEGNNFGNNSGADI